MADQSVVRVLADRGLVVGHVPATVPTAADLRPQVLDIAHRGSSGSSPENTLAAVELAVAQEASFVEVDIQRSADGELVVIHDTTLVRTTDAVRVFPDRAPWMVADFTKPELDMLDAGSWYPGFTGEPIPTLDDIIDTVGPHAGLLLELKSPALYPGIELQLADNLLSRGDWLGSALGDERLVVQSFDHVSLRNLDVLAPEIPKGLLFRRRPTTAELASASAWATQINSHRWVTDQALVHEVHSLGMSINVYTPNTPRAMRRALARGVDGVITDHPALLRRVRAGGASTAA